MDQEMTILAELKGKQAAADFAEKTFDKYIKIEPPPRVSKQLDFHDTQIRLLLAAKRFKSAENEYNKLRQFFDKLQPSSEFFIRLHLLHAEIEFSQMHFAKASKEAEKEANILISSADISADERQKMWNSIERLLASEPGKIAKLLQVELDNYGYLYEGSPSTHATYYILLGQSYIRLKKPEKALTALEKGYNIAKEIKTEHITFQIIIKSLCNLPLPDQKKKLYESELAKLSN
jgi:tetratricopeptide (TPR) repeat protein